jgi:hypothetical protein
MEAEQAPAAGGPDWDDTVHRVHPVHAPLPPGGVQAGAAGDRGRTHHPLAGGGTTAGAGRGDSGSGLTAYPRTERDLRGKLAAARVDAASFERALTPCSLSDCRGTCCYDGVYVSDEAAEVIQTLADQEADFFRQVGLRLPEQVIVDGEWEGRVAGKKTAVAPYPFSRRVADYPSHFGDTACVFLLEDGRCGLQLLSLARGRHAWYYKPVACWMHPISVASGDGVELILFDEMNDPDQTPEYEGFIAHTFCGKTAACGRPAREVLEAELRCLGEIAGRDFVSEVHEREATARGQY